MKDYKITIPKVLLYFYQSILFPLIFVGILYFITHDFSFLQNEILFNIIIISAIIFTLPMAIIAINHYLYFKTVKLKYDGLQQMFYFTKDKKTFKLSKKDILEVLEYNNKGYRVIWSNIYIWEIKSKTETIKLSNIIISKTDFSKLIEGVEVIKEYILFPTLNSK